MPGEPRGDGPTIAGNNRVLPQAFAQFPGNHLRLHRFVHTGGLFLHDLPPFAHAFLRGFQKPAVLFALQEREEFLQSPPAVACEPRLDRVTEPDAGGIDVELNTARLACLG